MILILLYTNNMTIAPITALIYSLVPPILLPYLTMASLPCPLQKPPCPGKTPPQ